MTQTKTVEDLTESLCELAVFKETGLSSPAVMCDGKESASDPGSHGSQETGSIRQKGKRRRNRFKRGTAGCRNAKPGLVEVQDVDTQTPNSDPYRDQSPSDPVRPDTFKPLYKRDKRLETVNECADSVLNATVLVKRYLETGQRQYKVGGYTVNIQEFKSSHNRLFQEYADVYKQTRCDKQNYGSDLDNPGCDDDEQIPSTQCYKITVEELPGLLIVPNIIPATVQRYLVEEIVQDLVPDLRHRNNLDIHYGMGSGLQLFPEMVPNSSADPTKECLYPLDGIKAEPISIELVRNKKLRWITLGGQYNWTTKKYPTFEIGAKDCPKFPYPLSLIFDNNPVFSTCSVGPESNRGGTDCGEDNNNTNSPFTSQAAIVNFYSPGDTLSPHQDVAEHCSNDLISLSIGCSAVFYVGLSRHDRTPLQVLVQSGDGVTMGQQSRFAFHGIGKVFENSCPEYLCKDSRFDCSISPKAKNYIYSQWIKSKRVNINVRQML